MTDELRQSVVNAPDQAKRRAGRMLELEFGKSWDFDDPSHEWRRLFSELLGTFLLVLVGAGGGVVNAQSNGAIGRAAAVTAPGLMVMAIILFMGAISGAHLNPAVSIAFAARGDFPWRRVPGYIIVQLAGATLACLVFWALLGKLGMLGATEPGPGSAPPRPCSWNCPYDRPGQHHPGHRVRRPERRRLRGPRRRWLHHPGWSLVEPHQRRLDEPGTLLRARPGALELHELLGLLVGPLAGGLIAVGFAWVLRGPGGDSSGAAAAQGRIGRLETSSEQAVEEARRDETA